MEYFSATCSKLHGEKDPAKVRQGIKEGINPNSTCLSGIKPLHWSKNSEVTKVLVEAGASVNARDISLTTPLHLAPDAESVKILVEHGANPNSRDSCGDTPLHTAKSVEIAAELIKNGADVNARNGDRKTPLHRHSDNEQMTRLLEESGADFTLVDRSGLVPSANSRTSVFIFSSKNSEMHNILSQILLPSLCLGIIIFFFSFKLLKKIKQSVYQPGTSLRIATFLSLLLNPFSFLLMIISFNGFGYEFLYWIPGSKTTVFLLYGLLSYIIYHSCMFYINWSKRSRPTLAKTLDIYLLRNFSYWVLLPYYISWGWLLTTDADRGVDFILLSTPYLIVFSCWSYTKSTTLINEPIFLNILRRALLFR